MVELGAFSIAAALVLLLAEAHVSTGGMMAAAASAALVCGVALLLIGAAAGLLTVLAVAGGVGVASLGGLVLIVRSSASGRRTRPTTGAEAMIGHLGTMRAGGLTPWVSVDGGLWRAAPSPLEGENALHDGDQVVVERIKGLTLYVRKADELELN